MTTPRNLLAIGLPIKEHIDPAIKQKFNIPDNMLEVEFQKAKSNNLAPTGWQVDALNLPLEEVLKQLKEKLQEKKYDIVCIGNGVRGKADLTLVFEGMVNTVLATVPGVKLGFPVWPWEVVDAAVRVLGEI